MGFITQSSGLSLMGDVNELLRQKEIISVNTPFFQPYRTEELQLLIFFIFLSFYLIFKTFIEISKV